MSSDASPFQPALHPFAGLAIRGVLQYEIWRRQPELGGENPQVCGGAGIVIGIDDHDYAAAPTRNFRGTGNRTAADRARD